MTAIIDGMGSIGAAIGPMMTGYISGEGPFAFLFGQSEVPLPPRLGTRSSVSANGSIHARLAGAAATVGGVCSGHDTRN